MIDYLGFFNSSLPCRRKFGLLGGTRLSLALRADYKLPKGELYLVRVPGLPHPVWLRAGTSDALVLHQILIAEELNFSLARIPSLIVDAGANIGLSSIYFAARYPSARVVALEIDRSNFELLRRNTANYPSIIPLHKGLWSRRTRLAISNPKAECWEFQAAEAGDDADIEAMGVADLLDEFGSPIDLLKIDIEGGEKEVFESGYDAWLCRVRAVAIELHDRFRPGCSAALERAIAGRGFIEECKNEYILLKKTEAN